MTRECAESAARTLRACGWDVEAESFADGWRLVCRAADGGPSFFGYAHADVKVYVLGGSVARIADAGTD